MKKIIFVIMICASVMFVSTSSFAEHIPITGSSNNADASSYSGSQAVIVNEDVVQRINPPTIFPNTIPMVQGGRVGDITQMMPKFGIPGLTPYNKDSELVIGVIGSYQGWFWNRIRLDEIEQKLIDKVNNIANSGEDMKCVRYVIQYKDSVVSSGINGGAAGSVSGNAGSDGIAGTGAILPGMSRSTHDPMYILKFYKIKGCEESKVDPISVRTINK